MALVQAADELLLARSPHFPPGMYSALAGFVEPGESLEQCVAREVAGGSRRDAGDAAATSPVQSWPFPHSLMIAFICEWSSGEIRRKPEKSRKQIGSIYCIYRNFRAKSRSLGD
jgi:NAD+ diphosphatase